MSDSHVRLLRRVAALRRGRLRRTASAVSADAAPAPDERSEASARADAQLTAAMARRRRRAEDARTTPPPQR